MNQFLKVNHSSQLSGVIRRKPEDFQVDEIQSFTPTGEGEHVWLHIKKTGENTDWVAGLLAKIAEVPRKDVSFAGMKDRHAVTTQWFSVQMPGKEAPDWQSGLPENIRVLEEKRHSRKLKRGTLEGNHFKLVVRDFKGDEAELRNSIKKIAEQGVPNYFGEQRFGFYNDARKCYSNILKAEQWFKGDIKVKPRPQRSIYLSAARSWIFNHILSKRVEEGTWNQAVQGDVLMLNGSKSCFVEDVDSTIIERVFEKNLHPTGALWGKGKLASELEVEGLESHVAVSFSVLCDGLESKGLKQERKSLRLLVNDLQLTVIDKDTFSLEFSLPAGAFATTVLNEIGSFK